MGDLINIIVLAFFGSVAGLIGGVVFLIKRQWARKLTFFALPFAAGVLIAVSLLHLLPESTQEIGEKSFIITLLAILGSFAFEQMFATLHHHEDKHSTLLKASVPLIIIGDTIHNFIDGVAIASAYLTHPSFGIIVMLATFLHETPHEIGDFGVMLNAGLKKKRVFLFNFLSALATFPGAFLVFLFFPNGNNQVGILLAVSAGIFLYLGLSDFLPEIEDSEHKRDIWKKFVFVILGVSIMYLLKNLLPEH